MKMINTNNFHEQIMYLHYSMQNVNLRHVTFQVTNDCCCNCSYCYQTNKNNKYMTKEIGKSCIDLLFDMYYKDEPQAFINKNTKGIIFDFIGGEPLLNIDVIDYICDYFINTCLEKEHEWLYYFRFSLISNGALYFTDKVQQFIKKYNSFLSFDITLDGPKEIHDKCRIYHDGTGNFNDAYNALKDLQNKGKNINTKITIAPENLNDIDKIITFFINENFLNIPINLIFEHKWTIEEAKIFYKQLIKIADIILASDKQINCSFFDSNLFYPLEESSLETWCGSTHNMIAFTPEGNIIPCIRFAQTSLNNKQPEFNIGNIKDGIYQTEATKKQKQILLSVNRRSQSTDECFYCPIAKGCANCAGYDYQETGTVNKRTTNICNAHKARALANAYFWNKYYQKNNINKCFKIYLQKEDALKIIDEDEWNMLKALEGLDYLKVKSD